VPVADAVLLQGALRIIKVLACTDRDAEHRSQSYRVNPTGGHTCSQFTHHG
jgi:hypothetical protein